VPIGIDLKPDDPRAVPELLGSSSDRGGRNG